jgi:hypothetical protein
MVSIDPILDFDLLEFSSKLISLKPEQIEIGAGLQKHKLLEPHPDKIKLLIKNLKRAKIPVCQLKSLNRILVENII